MNFPKDLRYTRTHEWARREQAIVTVGISDYAQKEISDVVFVELPKVGHAATQGKAVAVVESVKAAFDIYAPVSGRVIKVNQELESNPAEVNQDCYGRGWFFQMELSSPAQWESLLSSENYEHHLKQEAK